MKLLALSFLFVVVAANHVPDLNEHWENFKKAFGKKYEGQEEFVRQLIFERKIAEIVKHNLEADLGLHTYRKGLNEWSDLSHQEFVKHFNGYKPNAGLQKRNVSPFLAPVDAEIPDTVDWREQGLVTPIKNQLQCGSCWAFSATGSLEGQHKKKTGKLVSLSEQELLDCSLPMGRGGCEGGKMDSAFEYIKENNGIDTEESYPYDAEDELPCRFKKENIGATLTRYVDIPAGDEDALKTAVATVGPVSVGIDASQDSFQSYQSGIYDEKKCSSSFLDHAVLAVGYGTEEGNDYWLVKNSWGTSWGMEGYIKMSRNKNNQCGIATNASYPLV